MGGVSTLTKDIDWWLFVSLVTQRIEVAVREIIRVISCQVNKLNEQMTGIAQVLLFIELYWRFVGAYRDIRQC